ncbi:MAG: UvrD-helicase domain-containing protein, partial [Vallitaleaceae bacterium]|nr:UvrD-helicase domain-containing protein [Vallitaleaceae bacterium]
MKFTDEQAYIIKHRNSEILVSAAAGSGKTAVLVERIIGRILDDESPIDINDLLVVTFTKLAAAEMKERITIALEKALMEAPTNEHLINQIVMMPSAKIMTIHSFCLSVIRDYFDVIDLDPEFRVADETEIVLIKNDVLELVIERAYEVGSEAFITLVESFAHGKRDVEIEVLINKIRTFAYSTPFPEMWLRTHLIDGDQIGFNQLLTQVFCEQVNTSLSYIKQGLKDLKIIIEMPEGPYIYKIVYDIYNQWIQGFSDEEDDIERLFECFNLFEKQRLSTKRKDMDAVLRAEAKKIIDEIHQLIGYLSKNFFYNDYSMIDDDHQSTKPLLAALYYLVTDFNEAFSLAKKKKKIIDFSDIEHMALSLLTTYDSEKHTFKPSDIAGQYRFEEIMIDEYQDSSMVQEEILRSVSREKEGLPNIFMVGDVKQSIYKFRMAKPELFLEKYHRYQSDGQYQKAHLTKNFRSRQEVITSVNEVFGPLMSDKFGGVNYDGYAQLNLGLTYEEQPFNYETELLLIDKEDYQEKDTHILEALSIAIKIQSLINQSTIIYDKNKDQYRPIEYHDIAILHRAPKLFTGKLIQVFRDLNIPVHSDILTGYFDTYEVSTVMNILRIIDNPDQDIPLAGVLKSPIVGLSSEELAEVRVAFEKGSYYTA